MTKPETPGPGTNDSFVKGEPLIPHLKLGEVIIVDDQKYQLIPSGQLNPRNHEPLVTLKVVG